jgi:hypothetical protein
MVWPTVWLLTVLDEHDAVAVGQKVLARPLHERLHVGGVLHAELALIRPEFEVRLQDVDLRVREMTATVIAHDPPDVVTMGVRGDHRIDVVRIDAGRLEVGERPYRSRVHLTRPEQRMRC